MPVIGFIIIQNNCTKVSSNILFLVVCSIHSKIHSETVKKIKQMSEIYSNGNISEYFPVLGRHISSTEFVP